MAVIETWYNQDLKQPVKVHYLNGNVFSQDNAGNLIGVNVFDGENPATISGSVSASVIRADGATIAVSGTLSGNQCSVTLPQSCYSVPGLISIVIKLTSGSTITTVCAVVANVYRSSTDTVVDPGTIIPDVSALIEQIQDAIDSIPSDYSDLQSAVEKVWRIFGENNMNIDLAKTAKKTKESNGVTFTAYNGEISVSGTSTGVAYFDLASYEEDQAGFPLLPGKMYALKFSADDSSHRLYTQVQYQAVGSSTWVQLYSSATVSDTAIFTVPQTCKNFVIRFVCDSAGIAYNKTVSVSIANIDKDGLNPFDNAVYRGILSGRFSYNNLFQRKGATTKNYHGVEITNDGENIGMTGTATKTISYMLFEDFNNTYFKPGDNIFVHYEDPAGNVYIEVVTKKGATTHSPMLQTMSSGDYVLSFPPDFDYCRINIIIVNGTTYNTTLKVKVSSVGNSRRTITVAKDGTGDYTKLKDAVSDAVTTYGTRVIVKPGEYDLIEEYGETYLDSLSGNDFGMMLSNGIELVFAPTAYVTFDYDGQNTWIIQNFAPFNTGNNSGFTIDGLNCMARNCRYIVHDDPRPGKKENYSYNIYRNCKLEMYPSPSYPSWINHQIIGGGLGDATSVLIENCIFIDHFSGVTRYSAVSYHNSTSGNQHYESKITVKDCYFSDGNILAFEGYGSATEKTQVIVTNNCFENAATDIVYNATVDNMTLYKWNNAGR